MAMEINVRASKLYLLERAKVRRNGIFKRVGKDAIDFLNAQHRIAMDNLLRYHPSVGKTIMMGTRKEKQDELSR